jgi:tRNA dimethylallyltransferase
MAQALRVQVPPPAPVNTKPKVVVMVGPTASGKTSLGITLAQAHDGEIVSADSRQVYRGLDIGSGKVTMEEMRGVHHHLIDVADPKNTYTVTDFVRDGRAVIADIHARGKLPIIVGGSFFYVDALLGRISMPEVKPNHALREELAELGTEELYSRLISLDPVRAENIDRHNPRRLIRALEIVAACGSVPQSSTTTLYDTLILGIDISKDALHANIHARLMARLQNGMIEEVEHLHADGLSYERMEDLGLEYRYIAYYLQGMLSYDEMVRVLETKIRQFAKRQMTWLKRDATIRWLSPDDVEREVSSFLKVSV